LKTWGITKGSDAEKIEKAASKLQNAASKLQNVTTVFIFPLVGQGQQFDLSTCRSLEMFLESASRALSIKAKQIVHKSNGAVVSEFKFLNNNGEYILLQKGEIYDPDSDKTPVEIAEFFSNHHQYHLQTILSVRDAAVVCSTKRILDGEYIVIKFTNSRLEHQILQQLGKHESHIVEFLGTFKTDLSSFQYAFIMPQYDCAANSWTGDELQRCCFMYQLFKAIQQCHTHFVVHRDIKLSNILIHYKPQLHVMLADFGIATYCKKKKILYEVVGTYQYMAPELLKRRGYSFPVDIWGAGLVLYELATGHYLPKPQKELIMDQVYNIMNPDTNEKFSTIGTTEKRFLEHLLQLQPEKRPTASQVLHHPFLVSTTSGSNN